MKNSPYEVLLFLLCLLYFMIWPTLVACFLTYILSVYAVLIWADDFFFRGRHKDKLVQRQTFWEEYNKSEKSYKMMLLPMVDLGLLCLQYLIAACFIAEFLAMVLFGATVLAQPDPYFPKIISVALGATIWLLMVYATTCLWNLYKKAVTTFSHPIKIIKVLDSILRMVFFCFFSWGIYCWIEDRDSLSPFRIFHWAIHKTIEVLSTSVSMQVLCVVGCVGAFFMHKGLLNYWQKDKAPLPFWCQLIKGLVLTVTYTVVFILAFIYLGYMTD